MVFLTIIPLFLSTKNSGFLQLNSYYFFCATACVRNVFVILFCIAVVMSLSSFPPYWYDVLLLILTDLSEPAWVHTVMFPLVLIPEKDPSISGQDNWLLYESLMGRMP